MPPPKGPETNSTAVERIAALDYDPSAFVMEGPIGCNLCGDDGRPVEVARRDRYGYAATLVVCGRCGLGYLSPRLSPASYAHFYEHVYRPLVSAYHGRLIDAETVQIDQRGYARLLARFLEPHLDGRPRTILDVGGSTGVVAAELIVSLGGRATVLDPSPTELAVADAAGMETIAGFAEGFDPHGRQWDLVLLCQTIDHLLDVTATVAALRAMTADRGRCFVDVLDVELMLRRTGHIERCVKIDHPHYLTGATARAFFGRSGFTVVAERLSEDGHRGFVLAPGQPTEPDWPALGIAAASFIRSVGENPEISGFSPTISAP
ncbi:MAG: methyltransferase domain-containing protein [Acidimicrobiales bacterium]